MSVYGDENGTAPVLYRFAGIFTRDGSPEANTDFTNAGEQRIVVAQQEVLS